MEITNKNKEQVLNHLTQIGAITLKNQVKEILEINEKDYLVGSEYGTDKGYGARLFLIKDVKQLIQVKETHSLCGLVAEHEIIIHEDNGMIGMFVLYMMGDDSAIALFLIE